MNKVICRWSLMAVTLGCVCFSAFTLGTTRLTEADVTRLVHQTLIVFSENYIDDAATPYVARVVNSRLEQGIYRDISTMAEFAKVVGRDIRNISGDVHLSLMVQNPSEPLTHILPVKDGRLSYNHAFEEVRYLYGNIGYLKFNKFSPSEGAIQSADAAFVFLRNSDGLIIDMRDTVGGSPALVQHMLSYFLEAETVLWSVETRDEAQNELIEVETSPTHKRFLSDYPVWVLTSDNTASAAELFSGVLQDYGKAKIIGSITAGAGYYVGVRKVTDELTFRISLAKPSLPISKTSWEKVGINPDISVDYVDALDVAKAHASKTK